jgi:hypothetical protein
LERLKLDQPTSMRSSPKQGNLKVLEKNKGVIMPTHYDTVSVFNSKHQTAEGMRTLQTSKLTHRDDSHPPSPPQQEPYDTRNRSMVRIP